MASNTPFQQGSAVASTRLHSHPVLLDEDLVFRVMKSIELEALTLSFLEGDVVHAHFKDGLTAGPEAVDAMFVTITSERHGRKVLLMVTVGERAALTNEARAHASSDEGSKLIAADAIVVRDFGHQMSANAFVRHNKPKRPIQLFPDQESALVWLKGHHYLINEP